MQPASTFGEPRTKLGFTRQLDGVRPGNGDYDEKIG
jgi:hypothetical protein